MWLSLMKPTTRRCVSRSISRLTSCSMTRCQRRRRSRTTSSSPASERFCSPRVSVSWRTTKMPSSPIVVFALVGPRPVVRASMVTTAFEMAAASSPSERWLFAVTAGGFGPWAECGGHAGGASFAHSPPLGRDVKPASALSLEAEHVGARLAEKEELDRHVGLDARLAQEGPDDSARRLLDDARELLGHRLLEATANLLDGVGLTAFDQRLLRLCERLLEHHGDHVVRHVRLRPGRSLAVVLGLQAHDRGRDLRAHFALVLLALVIRHEVIGLAARPYVPGWTRLYSS